MNKIIAPIIGLFLSIGGFTLWLQAHPAEADSAKNAAISKLSTVGSTPDSTPPTTHLPAVTPKAGMTFATVHLVNRPLDTKLPDDCQDPEVTGMQNLVKYVNDHSDPSDPNYVDNNSVAGLICDWN